VKADDIWGKLDDAEILSWASHVQNTSILASFNFNRALPIIEKELADKKIMAQTKINHPDLSKGYMDYIKKQLAHKLVEFLGPAIVYETITSPDQTKLLRATIKGFSVPEPPKEI